MLRGPDTMAKAMQQPKRTLRAQRGPALHHWALLCLLLIAPFAVGACSSGLGNNLPNAPTAAAASRATGLGVDLGFVLTERIDDDFALAGALIPGVTEDLDRRISFVAFTTATDNDDADGMGGGTTLTRDAGSPTDSNGMSDVYIMAIEDELVDRGAAGLQPAAFSRALVNTFRHSRCVNCHAIGSTPDPGEPFVFPGNNTHPGPAQPILTDQCTTCHMAPNVAPEVEWRAPRANNGQPFDMRGETVQQLAARAQSVPFDEHLLNDSRVTWALESGVVPFDGSLAGSSSIWTGVPDNDVGPVPISFGTFRAQLLAWEEAGFPVTAANSIRDVTLVSRSRLGNRTGDGASSAPSITWVPNPGYNPNSPTAQPAGQIIVAYVSAATDLVAGGSATDDVYTTSLDVFVGRDPATSAPLADGLDLVNDGSTHILVSRASGGGAANGASAAPALDANGTLVAFTSEATNLVAGFTDGNGAGSDVFLRDVTGGSTQLVSATSPGGTTGGDGDSSEASISATGEAIAFSSTASDLAAGDTNGLRDVLFTRRSMGTFDPLEIASRSSGGAQANGASSGPTVAVTGSGRVSVVFESTATTLGAIAAPRNVFVHDNGNTVLLSQRLGGGSSVPGNGSSFGARISPTGDCVVFTTLASNLDVLQPVDANGAADVLLVDLRGVRAAGEVQGRRVSLDSAGLDGDAAATDPRVSSFRDGTGSFESRSVSLFRTDAEDLGATTQDLVAVFLENVSVVRTDFTADTTAGGVPLTVQFTDTSTGMPSAWSWDFGDGATSTQRNPSHVFTVAGTYDVSLTVTRAGEQETLVKSSFISALVPLTITSFAADNETGPTPLQSTFTPVLSGDTTGVAYAWDFGDGGTDTVEAPTHTYAAPGTYDVTLTVTGTAGNDTLTRNGYITALSPSGANFSFAQNGLRTTFTDLSTGGPIAFLWDFGDGNTSTQQNPVHDYADNGVRTVTLSINGPGGMDSIQRMVTVNAAEFSTVFPLLGANGCNSCHSGGSPSGGLLFSGATATNVYSQLVGVLAQGSQCNNGVRRRVVAFDSAASLLVDTVDPAITACNAGNGMGTFDSGELATLRAWIDQGATFD